MKATKFLVFVGCYFSNVGLYAQTSKAIEDNLIYLFRKIDYRSLDNKSANKEFGEKLKFYTENNPSAIKQDFLELKRAHLDISTSDDGLLRIYSWDTWTGGTMHFFENVMQYKSGTKALSILDTAKFEGDYVNNFTKIYSIKLSNKTYYLPTYLSIGSSKEIGGGILIFAIENGKLTKVSLIKTKTGLHDRLNYNYDFSTVADWKIRPTISVDTILKTVKVPLVANNGKMTHKNIIYKFTGHYFEKAKS